MMNENVKRVQKNSLARKRMAGVRIIAIAKEKKNNQDNENEVKGLEKKNKGSTARRLKGILQQRTPKLPDAQDSSLCCKAEQII